MNVCISVSDGKGFFAFELPITFVDSLKSIRSWDREYADRGRLWGGGISGMPDLCAGSVVLELGCGDGKTLSCMPEAWRAVALDASLNALHLSLHLCPNARLALADASRLPFRECVFDAVFAFHVTGHLLISGRLSLAAEASRVLLPGGRLFFREFAGDDLRAGRGQEIEPGTFARKSGIVTHFFQSGEAEELFSNLQPISVEARRWKMRVKGRDLMRCEVQAVFEKR